MERTFSHLPVVEQSSRKTDCVPDCCLLFGRLITAFFVAYSVTAGSTDNAGGRLRCRQLSRVMSKMDHNRGGRSVPNNYYYRLSIHGCIINTVGISDRPLLQNIYLYLFISILYDSYLGFLTNRLDDRHHHPWPQSSP